MLIFISQRGGYVTSVGAKTATFNSIGLIWSGNSSDFRWEPKDEYVEEYHVPTVESTPEDQ